MARRAGILATSITTPVIGHPFTFESLPTTGVPLGIDMVTKQVAYLDPAVHYPRYMSNRNIVVLGDIGNGKSSFVKTWLASLLAVLRPEDAGGGLRRAWIIDRKREYTVLAQLYGADVVYLGGGTRINILDQRLASGRQLTLLLQITNLLIGTTMSQFQRDILTTAYKRVMLRTTPALPAPGELPPPVFAPHVGDIVDELMVIGASDYPSSVGLDAHTVHQAASELFFALRRLTVGELAGLFDGQTSEAFATDRQVTVFQMEGNSDMLHQLVVTILSTWMQDLWDRGSTLNSVDFMVSDEIWEYLRDPTFASVIQSNFKLGRSKRLCNIILLHRRQDLTATGNAGEKQVIISENLMRDAATFIIFRLSEEDARSLQTTLSLTEQEIDLVTHLDAHCALIVMMGAGGRRSSVVQHILLPTDQALVDTDMNAAV